MAHTKEYLNWKISNCQRLVENATSEEQKKIYQGYLDFWTGKLPKTQRPEVIAKKAEKKAEVDKAAELAEAVKVAEATAKAEEEAITERIESEKAAKIAQLKAQLVELEPTPEPEELNESNFEKEFPNKKAYRNQNGERIETIAFKEYLNNSKSESE